MTEYELKVTQIGNSAGVIIPQKVLKAMQVKAGSKLYLSHIGDSYTLGKQPTKTVSPEFLRIAEEVADEHADLFAELASK